MDKVCLSNPAPSSSLAVEDSHDSTEIVQVPYLQETARSNIYLANQFTLETSKINSQCKKSDFYR
jgi:hypothetical protein